MSDLSMLPYYRCFMQWLGFHYPRQAFLFSTGGMTAAEVKPLVLEWAKDITKKGSKHE